VKDADRVRAFDRVLVAAVPVALEAGAATWRQRRLAAAVVAATAVAFAGTLAARHGFRALALAAGAAVAAAAVAFLAGLVAGTTGVAMRELTELRLPVDFDDPDPDEELGRLLVGAGVTLPAGRALRLGNVDVIERVSGVRMPAGRAARGALHPGDVVWLTLETFDARAIESEPVSVRVTDRYNDVPSGAPAFYEGELLARCRSAPGLEPGVRLCFRAEHVYDVDFSDDAPPRAQAAS
jgi:hypothetical protein